MVIWILRLWTFGAKFQISGAIALGRKFPDNRSIYPTVAAPPGGSPLLSRWWAKYIAQQKLHRSTLDHIGPHRATLDHTGGCKLIRGQRLVLPRRRVFMFQATPSFQTHPVPILPPAGLIIIRTQTPGGGTDEREICLNFPLSASLTSPSLPSLSWDVCPLSSPLCPPQYHSAEDSRGRFVCLDLSFLPNVISNFKPADEKGKEARPLAAGKKQSRKSSNCQITP